MKQNSKNEVESGNGLTTAHGRCPLKKNSKKKMFNRGYELAMALCCSH